MVGVGVEVGVEVGVVVVVEVGVEVGVEVEVGVGVEVEVEVVVGMNNQPSRPVESDPTCASLLAHAETVKVRGKPRVDPKDMSIVELVEEMERRAAAAKGIKHA